jgi:hypothetical protein
VLNFETCRVDMAHAGEFGGVTSWFLRRGSFTGQHVLAEGGVPDAGMPGASTNGEPQGCCAVVTSAWRSRQSDVADSTVAAAVPNSTWTPSAFAMTTSRLPGWSTSV